MVEHVNENFSKSRIDKKFAILINNSFVNCKSNIFADISGRITNH